MSFAANAGVVMKAPFTGRDDDSVGLALTYIKVGNHVNGLDPITAAFTQQPVRRAHAAKPRSRRPISTRSTPWWQLQADAQYTFNAGAGQNPNDPTQPLRNTFVIGVRTNITF